MSGIQLIHEERLRQLAHGYDTAADDKYDMGELPTGASILVAAAVVGAVVTRTGFNKEVGQRLTLDVVVGRMPPCVDHLLEKYRDDPIKLLAVAGAWIVAEIERLERAGVK